MEYHCVFLNIIWKHIYHLGKSVSQSLSGSSLSVAPCYQPRLLGLCHGQLNHTLYFCRVLPSIFSRSFT